PGRTGDCGARVNLDGRLVATTWGHPVALHLDPVEKKPLFHFLPGSSCLSLATAGCNLHCRHCQNWSISQAAPEEIPAYDLPPEDVVALALREGSPSIACTYTEPLVFFEYTRDICVAARAAGLRTILVTAGYVNEGPLRELLAYVDAANVDLKAFDDGFYREICEGTLRPVLRTLEVCRELGVHLEVTNLLIPTLNDGDEGLRKLVDWCLESLGPEVPLHFSRFHPRYRLENLPATPGETLERARSQALGRGCRHVYVGNLRTPGGEDTRCPAPSCPGGGTPLIRRAGYRILENRLVKGHCPDCGAALYGRWE
ncbi:MAG: AmmeMemoRadiSam system radical SAM enzyme, partial [Deltaproteobacteria bacterium]|nr:AmmeMemoRadiSam system radical SAM enzyme [Deltaproteobacteria bacterium]